MASRGKIAERAPSDVGPEQAQQDRLSSEVRVQTAHSPATAQEEVWRRSHPLDVVSEYTVISFSFFD